MLSFRKNYCANSERTYAQTEGQTKVRTEEQTDPILKDPSGQGWGFNNFISIKLQSLLRAVFKMEAVMEWGVYFGP